MADQADVRRIALSLPGAAEKADRFAFAVDDKGRQREFVWVWMERVEPNVPRVANDEVVAVRVSGRDEKEALLLADPARFFTEPHYNGFPAVLVRLPEIDSDELEDLIVDAWRCQAPRALVRAYDAAAASSSDAGTSPEP